MRPRGPWKRALKIINRLYQRFARISYKEFKKQWSVGRPPKGGIPTVPSPPTVTRIWQEYSRKHKLKILRDKRLTKWLVSQFGQRTLNPELPNMELEETTISIMVNKGLVMPSAYRFRRCLAAAIKIIRQEECDDRFSRLEQTLGVSIRDLSIVQRWTAARELLRYPPAPLGRANLPKMAEEYRIFRDLSTTLVKNDLDPRLLLDNPDCNRLFQFVERSRPSLLGKWEQRKVLEALPFYLAVRLRESIDAVLLCFVRKTRLLRYRIYEKVEESRREESLALLERSGPPLRDLQIAIAEALSRGTPKPLRPFQKKIASLYNDGASTLDRDRLHRLIGSRGGYTRKLARRLVGIIFEGQEPHARIIVNVLPEVFRFAPFKEEVPQKISKQLKFLGVPSNLLKQRQVFEPSILITLADYLWSGRMTASLSHHFSNIWDAIPPLEKRVNPKKWLANRRQKLNQAWTSFEKSNDEENLVQDGRLSISRPRSLRTKEDNSRSRKRHEGLVAQLRPISILEVILRVHKDTGFLDEIRLPRRAPHQLSDDKRLRLALGVLVAMGMNIGIRDMATVFGRSYNIGRVQHFLDRYMTKENLEKALGRILEIWDEKKMGKQWGQGHTISVDGRVVGAFKNNLLSRYHYRRGRSGMTVYWYRRDDGIATRVKALGNQEWEAWYVLDELLRPLTKRDLRASCGDTQGQFLALWGLAELVGKQILARFRRPSRVLLYKPSALNRGGLKKLRVVRWDVIERALPGMMRLVDAVDNGIIAAVDVFRRWHLYDERGNDIAAALRELGRAGRTEFLLRYAQNDTLQRKIQKACNEAEAWNSFHEAIFWGNGGKLRSNNPERQEESLLSLTILMNSIVFYNVKTHGKKLKATKALTPVIWDNIQLLGRYQFLNRWFSGDFRRGA